MSINVTLTPSAPFSPTDQTVYLLALPSGQAVVNSTVASVDYSYVIITSLCILYAVQIGACIMMLAVVLGMTPRHRFRRVPTILSLAGLLINAVRMLLLAVYFTTPASSLYLVLARDPRILPQYAINISATATVLSIPVTVIILASLFFQAWSMMRLWPGMYKVPTTVVSVALVVATLAFNITTTIIQALGVLDLTREPVDNWIGIRQTYLVLLTTSICWFCFLFNIRLVMHMYSNRTILPNLKGLKAMDVLVITNGILMFVPVIFAALAFVPWRTFESGSLTQTSVILILPLGTLIAQRLANPAWFGKPSTKNDSANHSTGTTPAGSGAPSARSGTHTASSITKRPLLTGMRAGSGEVVSTHIASDGEKGTVHTERGSGRGYMPGSDVELERIAHGQQPDLERGGVRVDYGIERMEEKVSNGGS
ncbi:fungal pheromone mating factor STE2 GPCR-domain-containing protein [Staphylotrichum tortipilum]|uniref:Fungal pheromone mating factor STE2 GPCR-domain-containing protein n=1 Tax=Staphylotrichum tortipilum TaxID=2831512 RepID=A0AAN6MFF5_9PEZI|nr:fungal pheromone mating factor STE2 GPCR-domain-containing protein [Staphylotrichum longicolle]